MNRGHHFVLLSSLALALALALAAGCGHPASGISGQVSYEGQPLAKGAIKFLPEDGHSQTCGGLITAGRYQVKDIPPGKKRVEIVGVKAVKFALSHEEMAQAAKDAAQRGDATGIIDRADVIPPNAEGNNVVIDVVAGQQTRNFDLHKPK